MKITEHFRRNRIEKLKVSELQEEELKLKSRINRLRKEIDRIEREKKQKFGEGVGADLIKKKMLAQELKQMDMSAKLKVRNFMALHKQYMFISNLVVIKKYQRDLQKTQIWDKIQSISPDAFESSLIQVNLAGKGFENVVDDLNQIFALDIADSDNDLDEAEKQMFEIWNSVETGTLELEEAGGLFSIEKDLEKAIAELED
ncbi:chromosome assembly protein [Methanocalculus sp.]|uniref:chromosome assembly protein n=1 Tax=Methanocalculus sp. TaxID=2004547 RepID=UPI0026272C18|nr:chromosome assembly protein [Methanocalculus sp.]MDG6249436.1 chromosome assembly protein [Methanocalculus sp.]